jgi:hypothetical protein
MVVSRGSGFLCGHTGTPDPRWGGVPGEVPWEVPWEVPRGSLEPKAKRIGTI